jgi:dihydroxyacetone synthase
MYKDIDTAQVNASNHTDYGENVVNGLKKEEKAEELSVQKLSEEHDLVLKTFRVLIADLCQQFGGGHPG